MFHKEISMERNYLARETPKTRYKIKPYYDTVDKEPDAKDGGKRIPFIVFLTAIFCVVLFGFGVYAFVEYSVRYEYNIDWERELESSDLDAALNQTNFLGFDNGIIRYSRDGAELINEKKEDIWEKSYEMTSPIMDENESYLVIADQAGTKFYIFNSAGLVGEADSLHPISKVSIADNGVVYAVLNDSDADYIKAFRSDGSELDLTVKSVISGDGYPFDIDVSPSGTELITSYVSIKDDEIVNNVVFRNFSEIGINEDARRVVGGFSDEFKGHLAGKVHFSTDEYSQAFYDGGVVFFSTRVLNTPRVIKNVSFEESIVSIDYNERIVGLLLDGDGENNILRIFSAKGDDEGNVSVSSGVANITVNADRIILYGSDHIYVYGKRGNLLGDFTVNSADIKNIIPSGMNRAFYIVREDTIQRVTM